MMTASEQRSNPPYHYRKYFIPARRCEHLGCAGSYCSLFPIKAKQTRLADRGETRKEEPIETPRLPATPPRQPTEQRPLLIEDHLLEYQKREGSSEAKKDQTSYIWDFEGVPTRVAIRRRVGLSFDADVDQTVRSMLLTEEELNRKMKENPKFLMETMCKGTTEITGS